MGVILLDFFGTLVDYDPSRTAQGYRRTHARLRELGADLAYVDFLERWSAVAQRFDAASDADDHEFSMVELAEAYLTEVGGRPSDADVTSFVASYLSEWNQGVHAVRGVAALLSELTQRHRLAVVTNTHQADLVPTHLTAMGVASAIEVVITSVEIGWRKPHPAIYAAALDALGVVAADCTFVGDTRRPDYDGPRAAGIHALLIDPDGVEDIPAEHRLASILDLRDRFPVS